VIGASRYAIGTSDRPGSDGPALRAAGSNRSIGDWNQARDGAIGADMQAGNAQNQ